MTPEKLLTLFKYYQGEDKCPFDENNYHDGTLWQNEKMAYENIVRDPDLFHVIRDRYDDALAKGHVSGILIDESYPVEQRAIMFYMEFMYGKWVPFGGSLLEDY